MITFHTLLPHFLGCVDFMEKWRNGQRKEMSLNYKTVNNQQDATTFSFINLFKSTQHVSGDKFAHPQEHFLTVYTAFGTMHRH